MKKIIVFLMVFGTLFAGLSITDVTVSPDPIFPGGYGSITATISSTLTLSAAGSVISGGDSIERVEVKLYTYGGIDVSQETITIGDLDAGASTQISIPIQAQEDAESGNYLVKIKVEGWVQNSEGGETHNEKSATQVVDVLNSPELILQSEKSVIGEKEEITLIIINNGGTAKNLKLTVSGDFAIEGQDNIYVGDVEEQTEVSFVLDSSDADPGINDVEFTLEYYDELGNEESETKEVRLNIVKEDSVVTITQESEIVSNKKASLILKISTEKNIEDLKISFPNEDLELIDFEKIKLGDLYSGQEMETEISVFASLNPGLNQVETLIEWKEDGEEKSDTLKLPITISSDVSIGIFLESKPTPLYSEIEHTLTVLVSNLGSYTINNVEVEVESEVLTIMDVQSSEYIGELSSDDFSTVQFKVKPTEAGTKNITIKVTYKDQSGEWKTENIVKEVLIHQSVEDNSGLLMGLGLIVILGIVVWYFKFRKK